MSLSTYQVAVQNLEEKLIKLLQSHHAQQKKIDELTTAYTHLKKELVAKKEGEIQALHQVTQQLKEGKKGVEVALLKEQLTRYMQEIDICIHHLENI